MMSSYIRRKVSQNRIRLENGRYDLDLTYICENIIAMGLPAETLIQSVARNPLDTVARFLKEKHNECYKIYNLLRKPKYNYSQFDNMVESFPMRDHNPPVFMLIEIFCRSMHEWLSKDRRNVAVVHCKAGKGRTGTMISCYFIYSGRFKDPFMAMDFFSQKRCLDGKGVTIPSQRRYVEYFADYFQNKRIYREIDLYLSEIEFHMPNNSYFNTLSFRIFKENAIKLYDSDERKLSLKNETHILQLKFPTRINGDIKVMFFNKNFGNKNCIFTVTFNTFFLLHDIATQTNENSCIGSRVVNNDSIEWSLSKKDIDIACKDKRFPTDMKLVFYFTRNSSFTINTAFNTKEEPTLAEHNAIENLQFTDDNGINKQISTHEHIRKISSADSIHLNGHSNRSISRSDSYVTPKAVIFDIKENDNETAETILTAEETLATVGNHNKTKDESRKVLLTEQSRTSSESDAGAGTSSSDDDDKQVKQEKNNATQITAINVETKNILEKGNTEQKDANGSNSNTVASKKGFSFFKKKHFFSLKKKSKKYNKKRNNNSNNDASAHDDTHDENSQSYDLLSNSSNNKISLSNHNLNDAADGDEEEEVEQHKHEVSNLSDLKNDNYKNFSNDDDDEDDEDAADLKHGNKNNNFKNFFSRMKSH